MNRSLGDNQTDEGPCGDGVSRSVTKAGARLLSVDKLRLSCAQAAALDAAMRTTAGHPPQEPKSRAPVEGWTCAPPTSRSSAPA